VVAFQEYEERLEIN